MIDLKARVETTAPLLTPEMRRRMLRRRLVTLDALIITLAAVAAYGLRSALGSLPSLDPLANEIPTAVAVLPMWLVMLHAAGAYRPHHIASGAPGIRRFLAGALGGVVALGFASFLLNRQVSRIYVALLALMVVGAGTAMRLIVRHQMTKAWRAGTGLQRVLLVGVNDESRAVADAIEGHPESGYEVVGFLDPDGGDDVGVIQGDVGDAVAVARRVGAGLVVVSPATLPVGTLRRLAIALEGSEIDMAIAPSLFEVVTRRVVVEAIGNVPILQVAQIRLEGMRAVLKRTLDLVSALVVLLIVWPVMMVAAAAVRLDSPGPVLFRQQRVGRDGRLFTILKFRTMTDDAEDRIDQLADLNEAGHHFFKIRRDPRVTKVGRLLRKWSIDETPQLWNVVRGDMSLVGPRPPLPREVARYETWHMRRLRVRPGITGLWQVSGRSEVPFDEAVRLDLFYIENWSVGLDLTIMARTVRAVLGGNGAY